MKPLTAEEIQLISESGFFDPVFYMSEYPDVRKLGIDPFQHYIEIGEFLHRRPGPNFDPRYYLILYPDVRKNKLHPLVHYIKAGRREGRSPGPKATASQAASLRSRDGRTVPFRRPADGSRVLSIAHDRDHFWYSGPEVSEAIDVIINLHPLPSSIRRILVVAHDFKLSTGVTRPISHYLNVLTSAGGIEVTSIEMNKNTHASILKNEFDVHDFIVINSLAAFQDHDGLAKLLETVDPRRLAVYLHETEWAFDRFQADYPERYEEFRSISPKINFLCVSKRQKNEIINRFNVSNAMVVYNTTFIDSKPTLRSCPSELDPRRRTRIIMAGTLQPRKGVSLFSEVADLAASKGLNWEFLWAGWEANTDTYKSQNVNFLGNLGREDLNKLLISSDVFFLSSKDDPFPLACLEAILAQKKIVAYQNTGISEVLEDVSGTSVFTEYSAIAAFESIETVIASKIDVNRYHDIISNVKLDSFCGRINKSIASIYSNASSRTMPFKQNKRSIAVILHLYYQDLWDEIESYLRSLSHLSYDLYVTLTIRPNSRDNAIMADKIYKFRPDALVLECPNRGMDVGPFVSILPFVMRAEHKYDLLLKIHSKKSISASGATAGAQWRQELLDGLIGSPTKVDRIISLFDEFSEIGMVGPRGMYIDKSSNDLGAGRNANEPYMVELAQLMGLSDLTLKFFRGTMFWADAQVIFDAFVRSGLKIEDFDYGHQKDNSKAHAVERIFPCIIRSSDRTVHEYEDFCPKNFTLLRDRESGRDIYVIAAGASCDFLEPSFFINKCVVGINRVHVRYKCDYIIMKEYPSFRHMRSMLESGAIPVVSRWDTGNITQGRRRLNADFFLDPRAYYFDHMENKREVVDLSVVEKPSNKLVVSYSSITTGIHFAAHLGARNIIVVGHDCGLLDGKEAFEGYYENFSVSPWKNSDEYKRWLSEIEQQTLCVRDRVKSTFGCNVVSLNPFVNFGLEGHFYSRSPLESQ